MAKCPLRSPERGAGARQPTPPKQPLRLRRPDALPPELRAAPRNSGGDGELRRGSQWPRQWAGTGSTPTTVACRPTCHRQSACRTPGSRARGRQSASRARRPTGKRPAEPQEPLPRPPPSGAPSQGRRQVLRQRIQIGQRRRASIPIRRARAESPPTATRLGRAFGARSSAARPLSFRWLRGRSGDPRRAGRKQVDERPDQLPQDDDGQPYPLLRPEVLSEQEPELNGFPPNAVGQHRDPENEQSQPQDARSSSSHSSTKTGPSASIRSMRFCSSFMARIPHVADHVFGSRSSPSRLSTRPAAHSGEILFSSTASKIAARRSL